MDQEQDHGFKGLEFSWLGENVLPPVRHQHRPSCWAYAVIAACEAIYHIAKRPKNFTLLSVQHLLDCYDRYKEERSLWASPIKALRFIYRNGGWLYTETDYPHKQFDATGPCESREKVPFTKIHSYVNIFDDEVEMKRVVELQPIIARIKFAATRHCGADGKRIIMHSDEVPPEDYADHCLLIVGYGSDEGTDYWLCQDSYGINHGDRGFLKIQRNAGVPGGAANIAQTCTYPVICGYGAAA